MGKVEDALQKQIELNKAKNLLYDRLNEVIEIDPAFQAVLEELLEAGELALPERALREALSFAAGTLIRRLYTINQFLQIDEAQAHALEDIYFHTWRKMVKTQDVGATLRDYHYPALRHWIARLYPEVFVNRLRPSPVVGQVACGEYSPELQIRLLRLDVQSLKQPVLDVGCGSSAALVRHLRALGIKAHGLDRHIETGATFLKQVSWFEYSFQPCTWGTIISNMAFTNHLLYAYHNDSTQIDLYTRKFHEIAGSLIVGGASHYAPSVPFVEATLESGKYQVERFVAFQDISMTRITKIAA